jgi:hypothetical protein
MQRFRLVLRMPTALGALLFGCIMNASGAYFLRAAPDIGPALDESMLSWRADRADAVDGSNGSVA